MRWITGLVFAFSLFLPMVSTAIALTPTPTPRPTPISTPVPTFSVGPPIRVTIDKIGVLSDHDPWPRGPGEIHVTVLISDGIQDVQWDFPSVDPSSSVELNDNETVDVPANKRVVFETSQVGCNLTIKAIAIERDSGGPAPLLLQLAGVFYSPLGLASAVWSYLDQDDMVGVYERTWRRSENWGIGPYSDVRADD